MFACEYVPIYLKEFGCLSICRRSADVRSVGYSELLVLCRTDVLNALKDYPTAEASLWQCSEKCIFVSM